MIILSFMYNYLKRREISMLYKISVKVKPLRIFITIAKTISTFLAIFNSLKKLKKDLLSVRGNSTTNIYILNIAMIKTWFLEKFKTYFRNVINSKESLNFTVLDASDDNSSSKKSFKRAKLFINIFFNTLLKNTNSFDIPKQLILFFESSFKHGSSTDPVLLTKFELNHIYIDEDKTFYNVTQESIDFMHLYFIIGKGLLLATED